MIITPQATAATTERALAHTSAALAAAGEIDDALSQEDRAWLDSEKADVEALLDRVSAETAALRQFVLKSGVRFQARVLVGDTVLDRKLRDGKAGMALALRRTDAAGGADFVFGARIDDLVESPLREEPQKVREAVTRFEHVPDYAGKQEARDGILAQAETQEGLLRERDEGRVTRAQLRANQVRAVADASDHLYRLEKRLLDRFGRRRTYVRAMFLQVGLRHASTATEAGDDDADE